MRYFGVFQKAESIGNMPGQSESRCCEESGTLNDHFLMKGRAWKIIAENCLSLGHLLLNSMIIFRQIDASSSSHVRQDAFLPS